MTLSTSARITHILLKITDFEIVRVNISTDASILLAHFHEKFSDERIALIELQNIAWESFSMFSGIKYISVYLSLVLSLLTGSDVSSIAWEVARDTITNEVLFSNLRTVDCLRSSTEELKRVWCRKTTTPHNMIGYSITSQKREEPLLRQESIEQIQKAKCFDFASQIRQNDPAKIHEPQQNPRHSLELTQR